MPICTGLASADVYKRQIQDSPPIEVGIVESNDPHGPFGAKEAGQGAGTGVIAALANAVYDATGVRMKSIPMSPDRIFFALKQKNEKQRAEKKPSVAAE